MPNDIFLRHSMQMIKYIIGLLIVFSVVSIHAQDTKVNEFITVDFKNVSVKRALKLLEQASGIHFSYSESLVDVGIKVNRKFQDAPLNQILAVLFQQTDIDYTKVGSQYVLHKKTGTKSQLKFVKVNGFIKDKATGENLVGVSVYVRSLNVGVVTNNYGYYLLNLPPGKHNIQIDYLGYKRKELLVDLENNIRLDLSLDEGKVELGEVVIEGERELDVLQSTKMSVVNITSKNFSEYPAFFGESDVVRDLQRFPGVQSVNEISNGLYVRGSSWDQTLIQLDEAVIFNVSHLGGLFSVFNPDAINFATLHKGAMSAGLGGRLSSVLDVRMKEGNKQKFSGAGGIGTLTSRLLFEGPIKKDKSSFMISARRSYLDVLLKLSDDPDVKDSDLYFFDLNGKFNIELNKNNRLFFSGYWGRDRLSLLREFGIEWGNKTATIRWNHIFNSKLFLNTSLLVSSYDYRYTANTIANTSSFAWNGRFDAYIAKLDFYQYLNTDWHLEFGYQPTFYRFFPSSIDPIGDNSVIDPFELEKANGLEHVWYAQNEVKLNERITTSFGMRFSLFQNLGPATVFNYQPGLPKSNSTIVDTLNFKNLEKVINYAGLEPRASINYELSDKMALKASYMKTRQYIHIVAGSGSGLPNDRWFASNFHIKPQIADQIAMGVFRKDKEKMFEGSVELYYKRMKNQLDFIQSSNLLFRPNLETALLAGKAWSYGIELILNKTIGKTSGQLNYTLSKSQRQIDGINQGKKYSPVYDRRHDVSLQMIYRFNKRLKLSGNWVYVSGQPVTIPIGKYEFQGIPVIQYGEGTRNQGRLRPYHRLDIALELKGKNKKKRKWQGSWNFSVYNAYFRRNPLGYRFRNVINGDVTIDSNNPGLIIDSNKFNVTEIYLFRFVPSITYNFKF